MLLQLHTFCRLLLISLITLIYIQVTYAAPKHSIPVEWPLHFTGDFRLRLQHENRAHDGLPGRLQSRYRFRLNTNKQINPFTKIFFGLASGEDNPRSTFETSRDSFRSPDFRIDHVYAEFQQDLTWRIRAGKLYTLFWTPSNFLFDFDLRRDGFEVQKHVGDFFYDYFITAGLYSLDEHEHTAKDPYLAGLQTKFDFLLTPSLHSEGALSYFESINIQDSNLNYSAYSNTRSSAGNLTHAYSLLLGSFKLTQKNIWGFKFTSVTGEYGINTQLDSENKAYFLGLKLGNNQLKIPGQWNTEFNYRYIEQDAWLDIFPDSNAHFGATNVKGLEFIFTYTILSDIYLGFDIYAMEQINTSSEPFFLTQFDMTMSF